jgi:type VI secretion system protein ImpH
MTLLEALEARPWEFDFHQALRRIECAFPHLPRAGEAQSPDNEPVRLGQDPSLQFAPAAVRAFRAPRDGAPGQLRVGFQGLFGPQGPLPLHVTELARERLRSGDRALGAFVDLFHHRMLLLLHRAWARADAAAREDRPLDGAFRRYLSALCGDPSGTRAGVQQRASWAFTARFLRPSRSAEGLESVLLQHFECRACVVPFVPDWLEIPESLAWRLGHDPERRGLGRSTLLGRRVFQPSQKFRVELGPLSHAEFERFLPGTPGLAELEQLVSSYAGAELRWDLLLRLNPTERPALCLGKSGRLGRDVWLQARRHRAASSSPPRALGAQDLLLDPACPQS